MTYAIKIDDAWVEIVGTYVELPAGQVSPVWVETAEPEARAAGGFVEVVETDRPAGSGVIVLGSTIEDVEGIPTRAWLTQAVDLADVRAAAKEAARLVYEGRRQSPMAWSFGATPALDDNDQPVGLAGDQTLQMREDASHDDLKNWLAVSVAALAAVGAGAPTLVMPIKTTANVWVQTKASELVAVLLAGDGLQVPAFRRGAAMLKAFGAVKLAIDNAADAEAVAAIDLAAGYPN